MSHSHSALKHLMELFSMTILWHIRQISSGNMAVLPKAMRSSLRSIFLRRFAAVGFI